MICLQGSARFSVCVYVSVDVHMYMCYYVVYVCGGGAVMSFVLPTLEEQFKKQMIFA